MHTPQPHRGTGARGVGSAPGAELTRGVVGRAHSAQRQRPPRFVYELTAAGRELAGALRLLADWGARQCEGAESPRHEACGSLVEARWWCPTCERPTDGEEVEGLHFA